MTHETWPGLAPDGQPARFAFGEPPVQGALRAVPEDFVVDEQLGFEPSGAGEHVMLRIEKRDANTTWVAGRLSALAGIPRRDVGFAGLKDRHAVTRQWFSVGLAGRPAPDWMALDAPGVRVLEAQRHHRKLRRGALVANRFRLRVRDVTGDADALAERFDQLAARGFPNLFGPQRFGRDGGNLVAAQRLFSGRAGRVGREQRGLYLSAGRALLFNAVTAARLADGSWVQARDGEPLLLDGRRSQFKAEVGDTALPERLANMEIHPSGPLWGRGGDLGDSPAGDFERACLAPFASWRDGLERFGLEADRRALRARAADLEWSCEGGVLELAFALPAGSFATALLRELVASPAAAAS